LKRLGRKIKSMKIVRYQDSSGNVHYGEERDGETFRIEGDIFGEYRSTDEVADLAKLLAPVDPEIILCIGMNYRFHAEESGSPVPKYPVLFIKGRNALQNPGDPIELPRKLMSEEVDYECELAVVVGKECKNATAENALDYVLGYTCGNDVSARDWQRKKGGGQYCKGKGFDTFAPLGPRLITSDELDDPNALSIQTRVNGKTVQDWNTNDMIFNVREIIAFLSGSATLLPGTVILTGTPHGVGMARNPPLWLKPGDTVEVEIEKIGTLVNPVTEES